MQKDITQIITKMLHNCVDIVIKYCYTHKGVVLHNYGGLYEI